MSTLSDRIAAQAAKAKPKKAAKRDVKKEVITPGEE